MRRAAESIAFLALASAVHAGAWFGLAGGSGPPAPGAGRGGLAPLELAAADPATAALVRRWQAPPTAASEPPRPAVAIPARPAPQDLLPLPQAPAADGGVAVPRSAPAALRPEPAAEAEPGREVAQSAPRPDPVRPRPRSDAPAAARAEPAQPAAASDPHARATPDVAPPGERPAGAQPSRRAEGSGARDTAGDRGTGAGRAARGGDLRALEREWGAAILARIARRQAYPPGNHGSGTARVTLVVGRDGRLQGVSLAASSGSAALDRAAIEAVRRAGRFPPAPAGLDRAAYTFAVPMTFRRD